MAAMRWTLGLAAEASLKEAQVDLESVANEACSWIRPQIRVSCVVWESFTCVPHIRVRIYRMFHFFPPLAMLWVGNILYHTLHLTFNTHYRNMLHSNTQFAQF